MKRRCLWKEKSKFKRASAYSLYVSASDDSADFDNRTSLGHANDNYSGGLSFARQCLIMAEGA